MSIITSAHQGVLILRYCSITLSSMPFQCLQKFPGLDDHHWWWKLCIFQLLALFFLSMLPTSCWPNLLGHQNFPWISNGILEPPLVHRCKLQLLVVQYLPQRNRPEPHHRDTHQQETPGRISNIEELTFGINSNGKWCSINRSLLDLLEVNALQIYLPMMQIDLLLQYTYYLNIYNYPHIISSNKKQETKHTNIYGYQYCKITNQLHLS